jgi:hypothetical protein
MPPLFDIAKLDEYKYNEQLPFECEQCSQTFTMKVKYIKRRIKINMPIKCCSKKCMGIAKITSIQVECKQCQMPHFKQLSQLKLSKSGNSFCSMSCAALYNNTHKTTGNRRSKLEIWLEQQLTSNFSQLEILYNDKTTINSELDIYIPLLKLAIELNGIFHYEPIYGADKLTSIQNNDDRKFQACLEKQIELIIIDSSSFKKFKEKNAEKYFQIIKSIIETKLAPHSGVEPERQV